jgi:hypothetical protein
VPTLPTGVVVPPYYTIIDAVTNAQGQATDLITPGEVSVTVSGITDAGPDSNGAGGTTSIQVFLSGYAENSGYPVEDTVDASSALVQATDLGEKDAKGNELYSWSVTLPTAGLAPGLYVLQSLVQTLGFAQGTGTSGYDYEADNSTVTTFDDTFGSVTYAPQEGTEIVSVGTAQSNTSVSVNINLSLSSDISSAVQLSTDGRYAVWTNGDEYEEDLQTGATTDLTTTDTAAPTLAVTYSPTLASAGTPDPYGSADANDYGFEIFPTFTAGGVTFGTIPDFDYNPWIGSQNPLPTVTDADGDTALLEPFGTVPYMVGYAAAASDNGNAVLIAEPATVNYFTTVGSNGVSAGPQYEVVYRSPAPTLTLDPVNGSNQFAPGATSVTLTGQSNAIGQVVEIDFGAAGAEVGTATVQADGSWSYTFNASAITGTSLFIEASVTSAAGTPARASETVEINTFPPTTVSGIFADIEGFGATLVPGVTLAIYVDTSAPVTVTGTPTLTLSNGEVATYSGGSGTTQIEFTYVPVVSDPASSDLAVTGLDLPSGANIADAHGDLLAGPFSEALGVPLQTAPVIEALDPSATSSDFLTNTTTPIIVVEAASDETITVYDDGTAIGTVSTGQAGAPGLTEAFITPTMPLPEGQSTLTAVATDASGRSSALSGPVTITVDTTPPTERITGLAVNGDDDITLAAQASLSVTVSGQLSAALQPDESVVIVLPDGQTESVTPAAGATSFSDTLSAAEATSFGAGGTISAYVTDAAGNTGSSTTQSFTADSLRAITLISADPTDPSQASGTAPALSADGTTVAFVASSPDAFDDALAVDDSGAGGGITEGIYVETLASLVPTLAQAFAGDPALSGDGTILAYDAPGASFTSQIYTENLATGDVTLISQVAGVAGDDSSYDPSISADGSEIAFFSFADNLVPGLGAAASNGQLYVATLSAGTVSDITAITVAADGTPGNGSTNQPELSGDGSEVVFASDDTNLLAAGDPHTANLNDFTDQIYVRALSDNAASGLSAGQMVLVSGNADGTVGNAGSENPQISANGRYVVFISSASNLEPANLAPGASVPPGVEQVYVKDLLTGALWLVSQTPGGVIGDDDAVTASISSDGSTVVFSDRADNLGAGTTGEQVYAASLSNGAVTSLTLLSEPGAIPGDGDSTSPALSANGATVVFQSTSDNLVAGSGDGFNVFETSTVRSVPKTDVFEENQAATSGPLSGFYLWSNAANWSNGVPNSGAAVLMAAIGADDIAGLSLASLSLAPPNETGVDGQLFVEDGLTVTSLTMTSSSEIDVFGNGAADRLTITGSAATTLSNGEAPTLYADGAGSVIDDEEAQVPDGLSYIAEDGALVELASAPSATSQLVFGGGTIALAAPGAAISAELSDVGTGDVLELPGNAVSAVSFGTNSLSVTTDAGTFAFSNVSYAAGGIVSYSVSHDANTGLEAITFSAASAITVDDSGPEADIENIGAANGNPAAIINSGHLVGNLNIIDNGSLIGAAFGFRNSGIVDGNVQMENNSNVSGGTDGASNSGAVGGWDVTENGSLTGTSGSGVSNSGTVTSVDLQQNTNLSGGTDGVSNSGTVDNLDVQANRNVSGSSGSGVSNSGTVTSLDLRQNTNLIGGTDGASNSGAVGIWDVQANTSLIGTSGSGVSNSGVVTNGWDLEGNGNFSGGTAGITNARTVLKADFIRSQNLALSDSTADNDGVVAGGWTVATNGTISGGTDGISNAGSVTGGWTVALNGTISGGTGNGISNTGAVADGWIITNNTLISGGTDGISNAGTVAGGWTVAENGTVSGGTDGFSNTGLVAGGWTLVQNGTLSGGTDGVFDSYGGGSVTNQGGISGLAGAGIRLTNGGIINNLASASVLGDSYGVFMGQAGTVINAGTIGATNGIAVDFAGIGIDRLILDPGATFLGNVIANPASDSRLELAPLAGSTGTLSGLGASFAGFADITVDAGADWTFDGASTLSAGQALDDYGTFVAADAFTNDGVMTADPSVMVFDSAVTGTGTIEIGADSDVVFFGSVASTETIVFLDSTGTLTINDPADFEATIIGSGQEDIACFAAGTLIATPRGDVAVEHLVTGDQVLTQAGVARRVVWLGHRRIACSKHPKPADVWPVRVRAGSFGEAMPHRELFLSPDHAVFAESVLIPVKHLINGATIVQEPRDTVTYWHVELDRHDLILAEGLPCESWLDTGNRGMFANGAVTELHPSFARTAEQAWATEACAPLIEDGPTLLAVRRFLAVRAHALGLTVPQVPAIEIEEPGQVTMSVAADAEMICLLSHSDRRGDDRRRLGVLVRALRIDGEALALNDARLGSGFHEVEVHGLQTVRWTNGNATVHLGRGSAARRIEVDVASVIAAPAAQRVA